MQGLGVRGVHIAERDTQAGRDAKPLHAFVNTWSVEGFVSESFQPAELGWGTHERWFPPNGHRHQVGCRAAIYLDTPGLLTKVHTWTPEAGPQYGFLVTHNEAISIADYFTVGEGDAPEFRPTCHYAYHPCGQAVLSLHEMLGSGVVQEKQKILDENEILWGEDCLGVLLYGHERNALWYGSRLSIQEARALAPFQNATGLQVTSAVVAGMAWALANPRGGDRRDRGDGPRLLPRRAAALPRPDRGALHRLDADLDPVAAVRRGDRRERSLAVRERAGDVTRPAAPRVLRQAPLAKRTPAG